MRAPQYAGKTILMEMPEPWAVKANASRARQIEGGLLQDVASVSVLRFFFRALAAFPQRHSPQECAKKGNRGRWVHTPQRHSREGGNPFLPQEQDLSVGPRLRGDDAAVL